MAGDFLVMAATWFTVARASTAEIPSGGDWTIIAAMLGTIICIQIAGCTVGVYDARTTGRLQRGCIALAGLGLLAVGVAVLFAADRHGSVSPFRILLTGGSATLLLLLLRLGLGAWMDRHVATVSERLVLVGSADAISSLLTPASPEYIPGRVVGWIAVGDSRHATLEPLAAFDPRSDDPVALLDDSWRIGDAIRGCRTKIDRVVIAPLDFDGAAIAATLRRLEHLPFEIALLPPAASLCDSEDPLDRSNCLVLRRPAITQWGLAKKRALDIVAASVLLVLLSPLMLLIAALIRSGSPGPALFRQTRWGWNNTPFTVLKFRTMWFDAPGADGSRQATHNDARITPIGRFLRRTSLDELPQLLNVLDGTMSLVGPRPHPAELNRHYLGLIDRYANRHRILPGITGLAQVNGFRGETPTPSIMQQRIEFDLEYIRRQSFYTDIWILVRTAITLVRGGNVY